MRKLRWQLLIVILALIAIGVLLVLGQQPILVTGGGVAVVEPTTGGVYSEGLVGELGRLNPVLDYYNPADYSVDRLLFSSLVRFDHRGLPQGDLAQDWGISQDGTVYNFSIRPNAVWHDGQPVTSDDILFTVELLRDEGIPVPVDLQEFWLQVDVEGLDDKTLQFRLPEPFAPFLDYLTFGVLPEHILGDLSAEEIIDSPFNLSPVGSGPYRFQNLEVEDGEISGLVLEVFEDYYGDKPYIEQIVFMYYPDSATALVAYQQGAVMGVSDITLDTLPQAFREPNMNLFSGRLPRFGLLYFNLDEPELPFFQDADVRRALLIGLNRQWIVDRVLDGQAILAHGPIFPDSWASFEGIEEIEYDPEAAIALLKDVGYTIPAEGGNVRSKDGVRLAFEMVYPQSEPYEAIAATIQENWSRLGVQVDLKAVPYDVLLEEHLETHEYQAALAEINMARSPDPDPYPFWHQTQVTGGQNYSGWDDRQASEYLEQARVQVDSAERARLYRNFQVRFTTEMPALPLFYPVYSYGVDQQVQGVSMGPLYDPSDRLNTILSWFLIAKRASQVTEIPTTTP